MTPTWESFTPEQQKRIIRGLFGVQEDRPEKLCLVDNHIHFKMRLQDGNFMAMTLPNTLTNRQFVQWLQVHD